MRHTKKFLRAGAATIVIAALSGEGFAADLPTPYVKAPYVKAAPIYNWTGFYLGVNAGVGASQTKSSFALDIGDGGYIGDGGFVGGVQVGFNWHFAPNWVAGLEGDIGFLEIDRSVTNFRNDFAWGVKSDWYGTLRGRFGYTNGPSLFYATGGGAFVGVENNIDDVSTPSASRTESETATGWTFGGGIETLFGGNWSAKAEYLYIDAGDQSVFNANDNFTTRFNNRFHVYRYGVNYKFGAPAATDTLPSHNWTGFYAGVNAGSGLSQIQVELIDPLANRTGDIADAGFLGGIQVGYNWQFAPAWVVGLEGDIGFLGLKNSHSTGEIVEGVKTDWYGTIRGRLGYSTGPALLYFTGGAAFVKVKNNSDNIAATIDIFASKSETASGWTAGAGLETALAQNWTAKTEYLYIDAGSQDIINPSLNLARPARFDNQFHLFRFGLNYKLGG